MAKKKNRKIKQETITKIIAGAVVGLLIIASIVIQVIGSKDNNNSNASNEDKTGNWQAALEADGYQVFYLGRPTCSWCNKLRPYFNYVVDKYDVTYTYINTDETTGTKLDEVFEALSISKDKFGTPYIVIMKDGKKINEQVGYVEENILFKFFQDNNVIDKNAKYVASDIKGEEEEEQPAEEDDSSYTNLTFLDYAKFEQLFNADKTSIIVVGRSGCGYCSMYKPVIDEVAEDTGLTINYIDYLSITDAERETLFKSLDDFNGATPTSFIVKNKEVIDSLVGYTDADKTKEFYKDNGLLK